MAKWKYRTNIVDLNAIMPPEKIECSEVGTCFVEDIPGAGLDVLRDLFNGEGEHEWELVQCHPHGGKLLCVWKKEIQEAFVS